MCGSPGKYGASKLRGVFFREVYGREPRVLVISRPRILT